MSFIPQAAKFFEGRLATPMWRPFFYARELYMRLGVILGNRRQKETGLADRFCSAPFRNFELHETGRVYACCDAWLPIALGNLNGQDAETIWNSQHAQDIRRSILDGSFRYCSHELCGLIAEKALPTREQARKDPFFRDIIDNNKVVMDEPATFISLMNDRSCNLSCPSCRVARLNFSTGYLYELRKRLQTKLEQAFFSKPTDRDFMIKVTGSGDPFASRVFREFLYALDKSKFPNLQIELQTNGTLFNEKTWKKLNKIHGNIFSVIISFDAATEKTYAITRRGGSWYHLVRNAEFLGGLRRQGQIGSLILDFVVQQANFHEMPQYIEIGQRLGADMIRFSKMTNWGNRSPAEHNALCVWRPEHPDYAEFQEIISRPIFDDPNVRLGNMTVERQRALARLGKVKGAPAKPFARPFRRKRAVT